MSPLKAMKDAVLMLRLSANEKRINVQTILAERAIDVIARYQKVKPNEVKEYKMSPEEAAKAKAIAMEYQREVIKAHNNRIAKLFTRTLMTKTCI